MRLGFIGLGVMGAPMARNLARGSEALVVSSARDRHFAEFVANGAEASTDARAVAGCDLVFLCLPDGAVVEDILFGPRGLAPMLRPGAAVIDFSTVGYSETREIGARLDALGVGFMDAPVSGMAARAADGTLTIVCGGEAALFERARPRLQRMGTTILHMGGVGAGQLAKLVNQLLFDINAAALAEILPMAAAMGLDPSQVETVVNSGTGRSYASEFFAPRILEGRFSDGYPLRAAYKDLVSAARLGAEAGIPLPLTAAATATYQMALRRGHGDQDKGAMIRVFEELLGTEFRRRSDTAHPRTNPIMSATSSVRLLCTLAIEGPLRELLPLCERECGLAVDARFGPTKLLMERLGGEPVDLAVLTAEAASALQAEGKVAAGGRTDLVVSLVGVAVPDDVDTPVWANVEDFVAAIRAPPSIAYSRSGASGLHFLKVVQQLGLEEEVAAKAIVIPDGFTAHLLRDGRANLAVQQISELLAGGARNIAPLPDAVQARATFSAVALGRAQNPGGAKALAAFLASAPAAEAFRRWGLVPISDRD